EVSARQEWTRSELSKGCQEQLVLKPALLQFRVLGFGLLQDGDVGIGVFPKHVEIVVSRSSSSSGGIRISSSRSCGLQRVCPRHAQTSQDARPAVPHQAAVIENLLELDCCFLAPPCRQISIAADVGGIETSRIVREQNSTILNR